MQDIIYVPVGVTVLQNIAATYCEMEMRKAKGVEGLKVPYNINHHHFQTWFQEGN